MKYIITLFLLFLVTFNTTFSVFQNPHWGMKEALLTILRDKETDHSSFRVAADKLAYILASEAAQHLETVSIPIETPTATRTMGTLLMYDVVLVPIVRSGLALLHSFMRMFEGSRVGFVVLQRDEKTALPHLFYSKMPELNPSTRIVILEPMIATGGSVLEALKIMSDMGIPNERIMVVSVICASEGLQRVKSEFPGVTLIYAAEDPQLNSKKFIVPGLGDFGDRYFGTM
jgi:uracil phosphoribosyltransferase